MKTYMFTGWGRYIAAVVAVSIGFSFIPLNDASAVNVAQQNTKYMVQLECGNIVDDVFKSESFGTGVVADKYGVLTSSAVIADADGFVYDVCAGYITSSMGYLPGYEFILIPSPATMLGDGLDYAFLYAFDDEGNFLMFTDYASLRNADSLVTGDGVTVLHYPMLANQTIVSSERTLSSFSGDKVMKTSTSLPVGAGGGAVFDNDGYLVGLVTGDAYTNGSLLNMNAILEHSNGSYDYIRDYETLYESSNSVCYLDYCYDNLANKNAMNTMSARYYDGEEEEVNEAYCDAYFGPNWVAEDGGCACPEGTSQNVYDWGDCRAFDGSSAPNMSYDNPEVTTQDFDSSTHDRGIVDRTIGWVVLQVQQHGEAWYVHPENENRFYMKDGVIAYQMMRYFGLGITDADLAAIPSVSSVDDMKGKKSVCSTNDVANRTKGRILLQVQQHGEAWYVHPETCYRVYMKDGDAAYSIMRFLSLGITDADLEKVPEGELRFN